MHRTRTSIAAAAAALALAAPTSALASGSLLTGYSHPGGGEQQQLGPGLIPPKHGNGGLRAPAKTPAQSAPVGRVGSTSPAPTPTVSAPTQTQTHASSAPTATHHTTATPAPTHHSQPAPTFGPAATPTPAVLLPGVVYPDASTHAGAGMPLSGSAMGIALLALLGMIALTIATRRVSQQQPSA